MNTFKKALRKQVPLLIAIAGPSGSGKTYSGLLLAKGLAGDGAIGFVDTENGRGEMYADSPGILKALGADPETGQAKYLYSRLDPPFHPDRYVEKVKEAEEAGIKVLLVDSGSHEWEGLGGCAEIAEKNKLQGLPNWSMAKLAHKRFVNTCLSSNMHIIFLLRARDKVKMEKGTKANGQPTTNVIPIGLQPIAEKSFVFEMLVSILLDEKTHHAMPLKVPEPLQALFNADRLITKEDGEAIRRWNEGGRQSDPGEQVRKRARASALDGTAAYSDFVKTLTPADKRAIGKEGNDENLRLAAEADDDIERAKSDPGGYDGPPVVGITHTTAADPAPATTNPVPEDKRKPLAAPTDW